MKPDAAVTGMAGLIWRIILIASNPFIFGKNRSQIGQIEWFFFDCANARRSIGRRGDHKAVGLKHNLGGGAHRRRVGTAEGSVIDAKGELRTVRRRASFSRTNASQDVNRNEISLPRCPEWVLVVWKRPADWHTGRAFGELSAMP